MKKNVGITDRIIRIVIAVIIAALYIAGTINGTTALILGALSLIFLLTGLIGFCPIYRVLGLSTKKK